MKNSRYLEIITDKEYIKKYAIMACTLFIGAVVFNLFIKQVNLVSGGANGIAVIFQNFFGVDSSVVLFILMFFFLICSYFFLTEEDTIAALFVAIVYPLFVNVTKNVAGIFLLDYSDVLLVTIFAGLLNGVTSGIAFKTGLNTGGISILTKIVSKYKKIPVGTANLFVNFIIVLCGAFAFGANMILYAFVYLYIDKLVINKVVLGASQNKMLQIISDDYERIVNFIHNELEHDVTVYNVIGKFSNEKRKMVMALIPTSDYYLLKESIQVIDPKAFIFVSDSYELRGQDIKMKKLIGE